MKKKLLIIIPILIAIIISIFLIINNNKSNNSNSRNNSLEFSEEIIKDYFEYEQSITNESIEDIYYYSDSYFKESSDKFNEHLRTFSLALTISFNPAYSKKVVNYNIEKILNKLEFNNIEYSDLNDFSKDTIGTAIATRTLNKEYDLVVVVLRGAGYSNEWESNLDLGTSGNANGFDKASFVVLDRLDKYLSNHNIKKYKLLVTGYSRSAAVASLVGVHINNDLDKYNINKDNLFVYAFESPRYADNDTVYKNIHNVINKNDIVTLVYPEGMGMYHNGVEENIMINDSIITKYYLNILSSDKIVEKGQEYKIKFINDFISLFPKDRNKYNDVSKSIIYIYKLFNNKTSEQKNKIIKFIKETEIDYDLNTLSNIYTIINSSDTSKVKKAFNTLMKNYDDNYNKVKSALTKEEYQELKDSIYNVFLYFRPMLQKEYNNSDMFINIITFSKNYEEIFKEHYFSVNFNNCKQLDSYYKMP